MVKKPQGISMIKHYPQSSSFNDIVSASRKILLGIDCRPGDFNTEKDLLDKYFRGEKTDFNQLKLDTSAASRFQKKVWALTRKIPYGATRTYKSLAEAMGHRGYRSIGRALHDNPWIIVVPCHRVIRSDGGLGGFGAGLKLKQYLLEMEKRPKSN
jgi:methylated-DNA-[protein]-cysteine S-methyltransferase